MADDRLPCCRRVSIVATRSDKVMSRPPAISFNPCQTSASRLTLVLWPATTIERLTTGDFIAVAKFMRHPHLLQLGDMGTENSCLTVAVKKQIRSVAKITQICAVLVLRYRGRERSGVTNAINSTGAVASTSVSSTASRQKPALHVFGTAGGALGRRIKHGSGRRDRRAPLRHRQRMFR